MSAAPRDPALDSTLAMVREGYDFLWNRFRRLQTDVFVTRVLGKRAICIHGADAARIFYDDTKVHRHGAVPRRVVTSLFGKNALHTLDGAAHQARKRAFLSLMTEASLDRLSHIAAREWRRSIRRWAGMPSVVLFDEATKLLTRAVCTWAGVPFRKSEVADLAADFELMVDGFGGVGPRLWLAKLARMRSERWAERLILSLRSGAIRVDDECALHVMAHLREHDGSLTAPRTAAIELINVLRPTVAIAWYIAFTALALHEHPAARAAAHRPDLFVQEIRRYYPFTPYLGAKVAARFRWKNVDFEPGTLVLLDVYGANHDPQIFPDPEEFRPQRFEHWKGNAFDFIPQGGGPRTGHRCPGEAITIRQVALALHFLTSGMDYAVASDQDLTFDRARMPTAPKSGLVLRGVRPAARLDEPIVHAVAV